jgi:Short C-terminal domain/Phospholipase_D-nuclease N-terminal
MMIAAEFGTGQVLWSIFWFFLFFMWIMLLFYVFADIFRSSDLGGWAKAIWIVFIILLPYLGVFVYLIARGGKMAENSAAAAEAQDAAAREYIKSAAGGVSTADEIAKLNQLKADGAITDAEFASAKAKLLAGA